jgi:hypothetical protein
LKDKEKLELKQLRRYKKDNQSLILNASINLNRYGNIILDIVTDLVVEDIEKKKLRKDILKEFEPLVSRLKKDMERLECHGF